MTVAPVAPFAARLREWRQLRGFSQLELAASASTTTRHLSFLETGRSRPSRAMVLRLASALELSLRAHNDLLATVGFAPAFPEHPLSAPDLRPFRDAIDRMLEQHAPFPAFVLDGRWNILEANAPAAALMGGEESNAARAMYGGSWRSLIDNWEAMAVLGARRLEDDLQRHPGDPELRALVELATAAVTGLPAPPDTGAELVVCPHFRFGDTLVRTVSVVAHFGSARDVTLDELRVELIFPADQEAEAFFRSREVGAGSGE